MRRLAALLDLDGTLIDSIPLMIRCFVDTFSPRAPTTPPSRLADCFTSRIGQRFEPIVRATLLDVGYSADAADRLTPTVVAEYRRHMADIDHDLKPFPGVPETLRELRACGMRLAVVTAKHSRLAPRRGARSTCPHSSRQDPITSSRTRRNCSASWPDRGPHFS